MKKCILTLLLAAGFSVAVHAGNTLNWKLNAPSKINIYTNFSSLPVSAVYAVAYDSDMVVLRCNQANVLVPPNNTAICWLGAGESATIELLFNNFIRGASGTFAVMP